MNKTQTNKGQNKASKPRVNKNRKQNKFGSFRNEDYKRLILHL